MEIRKWNQLTRDACASKKWDHLFLLLGELSVRATLLSSGGGGWVYDDGDDDWEDDDDADGDDYDADDGDDDGDTLRPGAWQQTARIPGQELLTEPSPPPSCEKIMMICSNDNKEDWLTGWWLQW